MLRKDLLVAPGQFGSSQQAGELRAGYRTRRDRRWVVRRQRQL
jgi:hypothetical protein